MDFELEPFDREQERSPGETNHITVRQKPVPPPATPTTTGAVIKNLKFNNHPTQTKAWRPNGLRPSFLIPLAVLSAGLLTALIVISSISHTKHGLIKVDNSNQVTNSQFFAYNYLPVIIAVLYSLFWQAVDSDARRYEPFPDMSRPEGIQGEELFFEYAYQNAFIVPYLAIRRKHPGVLLSSIAFLLSSIVLGSLSSSLMGIKSVTFSNTININTWKSPTIALENQRVVLNGEHMNQASSILLQNAALPAFTTSRYSISAFGPSVTTEGSSSGDSTLEANSTAYWAELSCYPMPNGFFSSQQATRQNVTTITVEGQSSAFPNTSNCDTSYWAMNFDLDAQGQVQDSLHIQADWYDQVANMTWNSNVQAGSKDGNTFGDCPTRWHGITMMQATPLANVSYYSGAPLSTTFLEARFNATQRSFVCTANYYSGETLVRIDSNNQTVIWLNQTVLEDTKVAIDPNAFDMDMFESRLSGTPLCWTFSQGDLLNQSFTSGFNLDSESSIADIAYKTAPNASELFAGPDDGFTSLMNNAFGLTFALAHHSVSAQSSASASGMTIGLETRNAVAVVVIPVFAIAAEVVVGVLMTFSLAICFIYWKRESILKQDPDSISAIVSLIADDNGKQGRFGPLMETTQHHNTEDLIKLVKGINYELRAGENGNGRETCLFEVCSREEPREGTSTDADTAVVVKSGKDTLGSDPLPLLFQLPFAGILVGILLVAIGALAALYIIGRHDDGYSYRANTDFLSQLLWSFTPTLLASILGASWADIHRDLCALEPFVNLQRRNVAASNSISLNYSTKPAISSIVPALRRKHFVVGFAAMIAVSTSVLQISMASLFSVGLANANNSISGSQSYVASVAPPFWLPPNFLLNDAANYVRANISDATSLPAWTTKKLALLPIDTPGNLDHTAIYHGTTTGFSASLNCTPSQIDISGTYAPHQIAFSILAPYLNGTIHNCSYEGNFYATYLNSTETQYISVLESINNTCSTSVVSVVELGGAVAINAPTAPPYNMTAITCSPQVTALDYNIQFNSAGQVFAAEEILGTAQENTIFQGGWENFMGYFTQAYIDTASSSNIVGAPSQGSVTIEDCGVQHFDWIGLLIARYRDANYPIVGERTVKTLGESSSDVYGMMFTIFFSQYREKLFASATKPTTTTVQKIFPQARQIPSVTMFSITFALLALYVVSFIVIVVRRRSQYVPRLPKSLGAIIAYCFASRMLEDFKETYGMNNGEREKLLDGKGRRFGFGWFLGADGELHCGVEREPLLRS